jgi:hypothetical protein
VGSEKRAVEAIFNGRWVWFPSSLHFDARNGSKKKLGDKLGFSQSFARARDFEERRAAAASGLLNLASIDAVLDRTPWWRR